MCGFAVLIVSVAEAHGAQGLWGWVFLLIWLAVLVWTQAAIVRLLLRHLTVGDEGGLVSLLPGRTMFGVAGAMLLVQVMAAGPAALMVPVLAGLDHEIGRISTVLSVPLMVPLVVLSMAGALRFMLAPAPCALGLSAPLADSWAVTEGHVLLMAATSALALLPPLAVLGLAAWAWRAGLVFVAALGLTLGWLALSGAVAGLVLGFYQRWQTALRPDMRPSRNRARRLEPWLEWLAGKTNALRRMAGPNDR
jgi:hypothetical protein